MLQRSPTPIGTITPASHAPSARATIKLTIYCDGASRGNPGPAAAGVVVLDEQFEIVARSALRLGEMTNNQAEYHAVWTGMQLAGQLGATEIEFRLDSELVVRQLSGEWRIKHAGLRALAERVRASQPAGAQVRYAHVGRESNVLADRLANWALDRIDPADAAPS